MNAAVAKLADAASGAGRKRGASREPIAVLGAHPGSGKEIKVMEGRYGPYVSDGTTHATLPKGADPKAVTLDEAVRLIDERAAKGPPPKRAAASRRGRSRNDRNPAATVAAWRRVCRRQAYATDGAAGLDVVAAEDLTLAPGQRHAVATGFAIAIPEGYEVQVRPRSGLALKHGITCLNTPGTIDHDYRGEVKVILANLGAEPFEVRRGERIAQLVPAPVTKAAFQRGRGAERNQPRAPGASARTGR